MDGVDGWMVSMDGWCGWMDGVDRWMSAETDGKADVSWVH